MGGLLKNQHNLKQVENINILFCFNKNYFRQTTVAITSLLINSKEKCSYNIFAFLSNDVSENDKSDMIQIIKNIDINSSIKFLNADKYFSKLKLFNIHPTYYRLLLNALLPASINKIIYSDADVIFMEDMIKIYNIDMKNNLICGAKDGMNLNRPWKKHCQRVNEKYHSKQGMYINAGVLLVNLKKIREEKICEKSIKLISQDFPHKDQDILNYICKNRIQILPMKYNFTPRAKRKYSRMVHQSIISKNEIIISRKNPTILHFINCNPWQKNTRLSYLFWKYASMTPYYKSLKKDFVKHNGILGQIKFMKMKIKMKLEK